MRRTLPAVGIWVIATIAAIALASAAIGVVAGGAGRRVSAVIPLPDSAASLLEPTSSPTGEPGSATPSETASAPDPTSSASPATAPAQDETRTYDLVGGSAAIAFSQGGVELVWATPASGFSVDIEDDDGGRELTVEFRSEVHRSRVKGWSEGGRFRDRIEEEPR